MSEHRKRDLTGRFWTWRAVVLLIVVTALVAFYPLGRTEPVSGGVGKIHAFENMRQYVLVVAIPSSLSVLGGAVMAFTPKVGKKARFWIVAGVAVLLGYSALHEFPAFIPVFLVHGMVYPNPAGLGIAALSGWGAMSLSYILERAKDEDPSGQRLVVRIAGASAALSLAVALVMAPYFSIEWRRAPAVLNSNYELAWQTTLPVSDAHIGNGFWFRSQSLATPEWVSRTEGSVAKEPALDEDALFTADGWIGRVRLRDGTLAWGRDFDFGPLEARTTALAAYWDDERLYIVNRSAAWTIFAFDWASGDLLWKTATDEWIVYRPDDPRLTLAVTPEFLVIAGEGGKAEYHLVDPQTGDMTSLTIPEPEGMEVAQLKAWGRNGSLGPNLVLGPDGTVALLAYFTPPGVEVKESWYEDGPPPEKGFLFGLDPATGEVAWQIDDIGDWRGLGAREGRNLWVTRDTVVRCGSEPDYAARVWDTSTGESPWARSFDEHSRSLATHYGVIVFHDLKTLECLDMRTGDALWSAEMEVTGDVPSIWLEGETVLAATPSWVRGIDVRTGHDIFGVEAPEDGRVMASDAKDGVLRVRVEQKRGIGPEESVFLDLKTGDAV
ncbi:MAG: PQQ-binding-like beta-propeller repeat protein, partial [Bacillota bacterium]